MEGPGRTGAYRNPPNTLDLSCSSLGPWQDAAVDAAPRRPRFQDSSFQEGRRGSQTVGIFQSAHGMAQGPVGRQTQVLEPGSAGRATHQSQAGG